MPEGDVAATPAAVETAVAGATPLAGITALLCVDALELADGDSVLVVGATGGVGSSPSSSPRGLGLRSSRLPSWRMTTTCVRSGCAR